VRAEEDSAPLVSQAQNQLAHVAASERIEAGHRLVEEDHLRIIDERLCKADALDHPLGELPQLKPPLGAHAHLVQQARDSLAPLGSAIAEKSREVGEQLLGGQVVVKVRVLGQETNPALDADVTDRPAQNGGVAGGREHELHQQLEGRGLPRSVRPQKPEDPAGLDLERDLVERAIGPRPPEADAIVLGQLEGFNSGRHDERPSARRRRPFLRPAEVLPRTRPRGESANGRQHARRPVPICLSTIWPCA
jgi:hypothetical protein